MEPRPSLEDHLAEVLVHGLQPVRVEIVDSDPAWPVRYEHYASAIRSALGDRVSLIEHIGSTSVPGLAAKPVIDIVIGIDDPDDEEAYVPDLVRAGYEVRVREPGHRCLRGGDGDLPVNLHCYPPGSDEIVRYLRFRDRLRSSEADRDRYAEAKRSLTGREWPDMNLYSEAKTPVVLEILGRAESEAG